MIARCKTCGSIFGCGCEAMAAKAAREALANQDRDVANRLMAAMLGRTVERLNLDANAPTILRTPAGNRLRITARGVAIVPMEVAK